jgi:hypothetical protein
LNDEVTLMLLARLPVWTPASCRASLSSTSSSGIRLAFLSVTWDDGMRLDHSEANEERVQLAWAMCCSNTTPSAAIASITGEMPPSLP